MTQRVGVYAFLAALVACAVFQIEAWPFSAFRLFSQVRTGTEVSWQLVSVNADGTEHRYDTAALPRGYRQSGHLLPELAQGDPAERQDECAAWLDADPEATAVRVYRSVSHRDEPDDPPTVTERVLRFECTR